VLASAWRPRWRSSPWAGWCGNASRRHVRSPAPADRRGDGQRPWLQWILDAIAASRSAWWARCVGAHSPAAPARLHDLALPGHPPLEGPTSVRCCWEPLARRDLFVLLVARPRTERVDGVGATPPGRAMTRPRRGFDKVAPAVGLDTQCPADRRRRQAPATLRLISQGRVSPRTGFYPYGIQLKWPQTGAAPDQKLRSGRAQAPGEAAYRSPDLGAASFEQEWPRPWWSAVCRCGRQGQWPGTLVLGGRGARHRACAAVGDSL